jgi:uncharacterized protein (DUF169 family)
MEWRKYAEELRELLALDGYPVAVTYALRAPAGAAKGKCRVCHALLRARRGEVVDLTARTSSCGGGTSQLGLGPRPTGKAAEPLKEFLIHGEKLYNCPAAYHRSYALAPPPPLGLADHVVLAPMHEAEFKPDVAVFVCNAEQGCRLVTLDTYDTGIPPRIMMSGATCYQAITYPVVSGELNVSLMDYTSRRIKEFTPSDLIVSLPYHRLLGVMRGLDGCTAGRAKMEVPASFRRSVGADALADLEG